MGKSSPFDRIDYGSKSQTLIKLRVSPYFLGGNVSGDTVDGSEIRRSPVEGQVVYPIIYKALYISTGCLGFLNHQ